MSPRGVVWFRRDLRLADNPAWAAATSEHRSVTALYVLDERLLAAAGPLRRRQLVAELHALDAALRDRGGALLVRAGDPATVVPAVAAERQAARVHWNADVTPYATARDSAVRDRLVNPVHTPFGHLVLPPGSVRTKDGRVHQVFTPFHRAWSATPWDAWPAPGEAVVERADDGEPLPALDGDPPQPAGEDAAHDRLRGFLDGPVEEYLTSRDELGRDGTSALSVDLRWGTLSPRHVVQATGDATPGRAGFVRQLAWRDWYAHVLAQTPSLAHAALKPQFDRVAWRDDPAEIEAWKAGRTGYPVVDAGMRELAATGRMHNRVRMITASFLVKDLLVDWRIGERHFRRLLLDADVAQNAGNWQWVAGTGPDAAPYFRVFNPVTQSRTHDPRGHYLRRWLPELAALPDAAIHAPWEAGPLELAAAGVVLGDTYPFPIVDHAFARERVVAAYRVATRT